MDNSTLGSRTVINTFFSHIGGHFAARVGGRALSDNKLELALSARLLEEVLNSPRSSNGHDDLAAVNGE